MGQHGQEFILATVGLAKEVKAQMPLGLVDKHTDQSLCAHFLGDHVEMHHRPHFDPALSLLGRHHTELELQPAEIDTGNGGFDGGGNPLSLLVRNPLDQCTQFRRCIGRKPEEVERSLTPFDLVLDQVPVKDGCFGRVERELQPLAAHLQGIMVQRALAVVVDLDTACVGQRIEHRRDLGDVRQPTRQRLSLRQPMRILCHLRNRTPDALAKQQAAQQTKAKHHGTESQQSIDRAAQWHFAKLCRLGDRHRPDALQAPPGHHHIHPIGRQAGAHTTDRINADQGLKALGNRLAEVDREVTTAGRSQIVAIRDHGDGPGSQPPGDDFRQTVRVDPAFEHPAHCAAARNRYRNRDQLLTRILVAIDVREHRLVVLDRLSDMRLIDRRQVAAQWQIGVHQHRAIELNRNDAVPAFLSRHQLLRVAIEHVHLVGIERRKIAQQPKLTGQTGDFAIDRNRQRVDGLGQITPGIVAAGLPDDKEQPERERQQRQHRQNGQAGEQDAQTDAMWSQPSWHTVPLMGKNEFYGRRAMQRQACQTENPSDLKPSASSISISQAAS